MWIAKLLSHDLCIGFLEFTVLWLCTPVPLSICYAGPKYTNRYALLIGWDFCNIIFWLFVQHNTWNQSHETNSFSWKEEEKLHFLSACWRTLTQEMNLKQISMMIVYQYQLDHYRNYHATPWSPSKTLQFNFRIQENLRKNPWKKTFVEKCSKIMTTPSIFIWMGNNKDCIDKSN